MPDVEPKPSVDPTPDVDPATATATPTGPAATAGEIVARRDRTHYVKRCVLIPALIVFAGLYFLYDGYIGYPAENRRFDELTQQAKDAGARGDVKAEADLLESRKSVTRHDEFQLRLQRQLGYGLLPLGVLAFVFFSRQSRGQYRLADDVLYAPGHPPVPLGAVREIDKTKWEKKGIAYVRYEIEDPAGGVAATGRVKLDDALYEQGPTTAILKTIEAKVAPPAEADEAGSGEGGSGEGGSGAAGLAATESVSARADQV